MIINNEIMYREVPARDYFGKACIIQHILIVNKGIL